MNFMPRVLRDEAERRLLEERSERTTWAPDGATNSPFCWRRSSPSWSRRCRWRRRGAGSWCGSSHWCWPLSSEGHWPGLRSRQGVSWPLAPWPDSAEAGDSYPGRQNSIVTSTPGFCSCLSDGGGCPDGGGDDDDQTREGEGRREVAGTRWI